MFKIGDEVTWTSSGTSKTGVVVRVLSRPEIPFAVHKKEFPKHRRMFDGSQIPGGYAHGYLVEVRDGKTARAAPKLYLPYPTSLTATKHYKG